MSLLVSMILAEKENLNKRAVVTMEPRINAQKLTRKDMWSATYQVVLQMLGLGQMPVIAKPKEKTSHVDQEIRSKQELAPVE